MFSVWALLPTSRSSKPSFSHPAVGRLHHAIHCPRRVAAAAERKKRDQDDDIARFDFFFAVGRRRNSGRGEETENEMLARPLQGPDKEFQNV